MRGAWKRRRINPAPEAVGAYHVGAPTGATMASPTTAARRLLILCGLVPLPEMTQDEVDSLCRMLIEDAAQVEEADARRPGDARG